MTTASIAGEQRELEQLYHEQPAAYRRRVLGLILVGYGYVVLSVLLLLGFVGGGVALFWAGKLRFGMLDEFLRVAIPAVVLAALMLRAFFVRIPSPPGTYLSGSLQQRVLGFVEPIRQAARGVRVHQVVIDDSLNAAVQQRPRLGILGSSRNYLVLGVPLLQLLSAEEVRAVVAHEFGHLSHAHGRMGAMVYRLEATLFRAAQAMQAKVTSGVGKLSFRFLTWFYPRFKHLTFALRRAQEYEADRVAAEAEGARALASALCRLHTARPALKAFWDSVYMRASSAADITGVFPHHELIQQVARLHDAKAAGRSLDAALREETGYTDSHPCLRDRLAALERDPVPEPDGLPSAIEEMFEPTEREQLLGLADEGWQRDKREQWQRAHASYTRGMEGMRALQARRDEISHDDLLRLARVEERFDGEDSARTSYLKLAERFPESAVAQLHWARLHLERDPAQAEAALIRSVELDLNHLPTAQRLLQYAHAHAGRAGEAVGLDRFREEYDRTIGNVNAERRSVSVDDEIVPHTLRKRDLDLFCGAIRGFPEIRRVYLAEKRVEFMPEHRAFVLGFEVNYYHDNVEVDEETWLERVGEQVGSALPEPNRSFRVLLARKSPWRRRLSAIPGALVHESDNLPIWQKLRRR